LEFKPSKRKTVSQGPLTNNCNGFGIFILGDKIFLRQSYEVREVFIKKNASYLPKVFLRRSMAANRIKILWHSFLLGSTYCSSFIKL
jgi:hypothetical protein